MLKFIVGVVIGGVAAALYWSVETRDRVSQRLAAAPGPVRQSVASVAASTATGAQRMASAIEGSPLPAQVKDRARPVSAGLESAAESVRKQAAGVVVGPSASSAPVTVPSVPEEVLADQDAAARADAEAKKRPQTGA